MKNAVFIAGTDTDIGKTYVSCLLLRAINAMGLTSSAIKPIASGCHRNAAGQLRNQDALDLQQHASFHQAYDTVNPIAFEKPIAPHIAASESNTPLNIDVVCQAITNSMQADADVNFIEGVGGWSVPLNESETLADAIISLNLPVILVVGVKLGCLNHALLTYQAILQQGVPLIAWVANCICPETLSLQENIATLKHWLQVPCLGVVPYDCQTTKHLNTELIKQVLL